MQVHPEIKQENMELSSISSGKDSKMEMEHPIVEVQEQSWRKININENQSQKYKSNNVSNTKYNVITFLPKNLFEQFRRIANFYFLVITIITLTPASPFDPFGFLSALILIIVTNMIKEIYEDWQRYKQDKKVNNDTTNVLQDGKLKTTLWRELTVGSIVKIMKDQPIPADVVILSTNLPVGYCYVQTTNLDGESNLKLKQAPHETHHFQDEESLGKLKGSINCEQPTPKLDTYLGSLHLKDSERSISLGISNILIRGTVLRNSEWVYGIVVYTGHETKAMLNTARGTPSKRSHVEKMMNPMLVIVLIIEFVLSGISAGIFTYYENQFNGNTWYLIPEGVSTTSVIASFFTFVALYGSMVPISLYVSIEIIRILQAIFFRVDPLMYDKTTEAFAECRNSNLNEELGQITHLFSDKTGTLTRNEMVMKKCCIVGRTFGEDSETPVEDVSIASDFRDKKLSEIISDHKSHEIGEFVMQFFNVLTLCHTAIPEKRSDGKISFQSSSPDEVALVLAAQNAGFQFKACSGKSTILRVNEKDCEYKVLAVIDFSSYRRRMTTIVQDGESIKLYIKGADSVILERLHKSKQMHDVNKTIDQIQEFANIGLRTLCIAYKEISKEDFDPWFAKFHDANTTIKDREKRIDEVAELIENDLILLGATGIEDKLQDGVPDVIKNLLLAGIKVWVLTGDKTETAINVGRACNLISSSQPVYKMSANSKEMAKSQLDECENKIKEGKWKEFVIVITGEALSHVLKVDELQFLRILQDAHSVLCCRVTPLQKSKVVKLIKTREKNSITLSIGDGANDVGMIQKAHVGVGVKGKEGRQAVLASDYAIGQFLQRLILVHGRWNYQRISILILYMFYKNFGIAIIQLWYAFYNGFSGQTYYDITSGVWYNVAFTSVPILVMGTLEQDLTEETILKFPQLYQTGPKNLRFNKLLLTLWIVSSIYDTLVIFFTVMWTYSEQVSTSGCDFGMWEELTAGFILLVIIVNLKISIEMRYWTLLHHIALWGTIIVFLAYMLAYTLAQWTFLDSFQQTAQMYYVFPHLLMNANFWLLLVLVIVLTLAPHIILKYVIRNYFPRSYHIAQELQKSSYAFAE